MSITVAGRYRRGARIAQGGSSSVHRATDATTGADVALKVFHVHRAFDAALLPALRDARAVTECAGPDAIVPILDVGADDDGTPFVVMPLVPGRTLGDLLEAGRKDRRGALELARRALASVDALHAAGATHGDLAPDNVLVADDGRVLLLDHEGIGAIGAPRPARLTEGFGREGGARERADDHQALALIAGELAGRSGETPSEAAIAGFVSALRERDLEAASTALGWGTLDPPHGRARPVEVRRTHVVMGIAVCVAICVALALAWMRLG